MSRSGELADAFAPEEALPATICALFQADSFDLGVAFITFGVHDLEEWASPDFSFSKWTIRLPAPLFVEYKKQIRFACDDWGNETSIHEGDFHARIDMLGGEIIERAGLRSVSDVLVEPRVDFTLDWRERGADYLQGIGLNNQGNIFASNRPRIPHDDLVFRTMSETYVHEALVRRKAVFMPLPVVMRNDKMRKNGSAARIEPDFVILYRGKTVILEVDGGIHQESPVDAQERVAFMERAGAYVERIRTEKCGDVEGAMLAVKDVLEKIDGRIDAR